MRLHVQVPLAALAVFALGTIWVLTKDVSLGPPLSQAAEGAGLEAPELGLGSETLVGTLLDADGAPLVEASVFTALRGRPLYTSTDGAGRFELQGLDAGDVVLSLLARGYDSMERTVTVGAGPVEIRFEGERLAVPVLPDPVQSDLLGAVEMPAGQRAPEGYEVYLEPTTGPELLGGPIPRRATVSANGSFQVPELIHGLYAVRLLPPYAAGGDWPDLLTGFEEPPTTYEHGTLFPGMRLVARCGELAGVAQSRDPIGVDPEPLEGALLRAQPDATGGVEVDRRPRIHPAATSDAEGRWLLRDLPPGRYRVNLTAGGDTREKFVTIPAGTRVDPGL